MREKPSYQELEQKINYLEKRLDIKQGDYVSCEFELNYKDILENIDPVINVFLPDTTELYVNRSFEQYFGITKEEIQGKKILQLIPDEEHADLLNYLNSFTQDYPVGTYKNSVIITDGTIRTFLWTNHAYFDDSGYISHYTGVGQDITKLENSRFALYKSEEKFRMIADTSVEVIWQLDLYGRLNYSSPSANIIFGYTPQEIVGQTYNKFLYTEEDIDRANRAFQKALSGKEHQFIELYAIYKDGTIFPIEVSIAPIYKDDAIHGVQGIARDISERKEKEKAILDSEKKYRLIAENVTDVIWTTDLYGNFTFVTPSVQRMFGYTQEEASHLSFSDILPSEEKQLVYRSVQKALEKDAKNALSKDPGCFELRQIKKDGSIFWTEIMVTPSRNEAGEIVGFQGSTRDINERKQTEEALHRSENYYRAIFETSGTAMFIINEDTTIALANSHFEELSGYARQQLEGKKYWTEFIHPEDMAWMKEYHYLRRHDPDAAPRQYECRFIDRHGEKRDLLLLVDIIPETSQSIASIVDLTERNQLAERLRSREFFLNSVLDSVQDGISIIEPDLTIRRVNEVMRQWYAFNMPLEGKKCYVAYHNASEPCSSCPTRRCFQSGRKEYEEIPGLSGSSAQWIEVYSYPMKDETENVNYVVELVRDITQRKLAEQALQESERKYRQEKEYLDNLIHNSADAVIILDEHGRIVRWNKQAQEASGYSYQDVRGAHFSRFHADGEQLERMLFELRKKGSIQNYEISLLAKDGRELPCSISISTIYDTENKLIGSINILRDLTEWKKIQQKLEKMSLYDSLTGLYNRNFFEEEMERLSDGRHNPLGIIACDLDGLKFINDTLGHQAGDQMLINIAEILRQNFRSSDIIARIGGDEFAVLLTETDPEVVELMLQRLRQSVQDYNSTEPEIPLSLSIGHALGEGETADMHALFREADNQMYREKIQRAESTRSAILQAITKTMQARDFDTEGHCDRLQELAASLARSLNLSQDFVNDLYLLARFHDLGKVGVPDHILFKPGSLTEEEWQQMRQHCEIGHRIASSVPDLESIADWILKHHEWWDGQGYPLGLRGQDIPLPCRILAIADAYDAMTSDRPYRTAMSRHDAVQELRRCAGTQFDPELVEQFIQVAERYGF